MQMSLEGMLQESIRLILLLQPYVTRIILLVVVWLAYWRIRLLIPHVVSHLIERRKSPEQARQLFFLKTAATWGAFIVALILSVGLLGLTSLATSMLAAAGASGIIIGFAVKDVAANLVSGIFLLADQPFLEGDVIETAQVRGRVQTISLRSTEVRTELGALVSIPNSLLATTPVTNYTTQAERQLRLTLNVPRTVDLDALTDALKQVAYRDLRVVNDEQARVILKTVTNETMDIDFIVHIANADYFALQADLRRAAMQTLAQRAIPFNTLA